VLTLTLPVAPSVNSAWINRRGSRGRGRIKSAKYQAWLKQADASYLLQKKEVLAVRGPYRCGMIFPRKLRGDLDNRTKLILDWMVSRGLTSDDKFLQGLHCVRDDVPDGYVIVQVKEEGPHAGSFVSGATTLVE